jgi:trans-aconitate methyltransferase
MAGLDWERFYGFTKDSPPWPLLMRAAALAPRAGRALDLGAGAGRDTRYLLEQGFTVTAVDADPHAVAHLASLPQDRLRVVQSSFEDFAFAPAGYYLISAQFALPFVPRDRFFAVFARLQAALAPGGVFAGQCFGPRDQWNAPGHSMTFLTRGEVAELLRGLEVIELREEDADGHTASGSPKHWHVFHILARRPSAA